jgi:hypothetical protein
MYSGETLRRDNSRYLFDRPRMAGAFRPDGELRDAAWRPRRPAQRDRPIRTCAPGRGDTPFETIRLTPLVIEVLPVPSSGEDAYYRLPSRPVSLFTTIKVLGGRLQSVIDRKRKDLFDIKSTHQSTPFCYLKYASPGQGAPIC